MGEVIKRDDSAEDDYFEQLMEETLPKWFLCKFPSSIKVHHGKKHEKEWNATEHYTPFM